MELWEENEQKKEYLRSYKMMAVKERSLQKDIQDLRSSEMFPRAMNYDGMPKGKTDRDLSDYAVQLEEKLEELKKQHSLAMLKKLEIKDQIRKVSDPELQELLELKYISSCKWEEIAVKMGYTYRHVTRLHGKALENFKMP